MIVIFWIISAVIWLICAAIVIGAVISIVMVVKSLLSYRKRKVKGEAVTKSLVVLVIGISLAVLTVPMGISLVKDEVRSYIKKAEEEKQVQLNREEDRKRYAYFNEKVDTGVKAERDDTGSFFPTYLTIKGQEYVIVNGAEVSFEDKDRGMAAANLDEYTIFDYSNEAECRMVCMSTAVYCHIEDTEKLAEYSTAQNNEQYYCSRCTPHDYIEYYNPVPDDEMFDRLFNMKDGISAELPDTGWKGTCRIRQFGYLRRTIYVSVYDDDVYLEERTCDFGRELLESTKYIITDEELKEYWHDHIIQSYDTPIK
ncbi:MAG: hypothetical protein IJ007_01150 [Oscillospiraceae bacterium]|nr:hypothetical protein [Oscillospiraceae bacterium]